MSKSIAQVMAVAMIGGILVLMAACKGDVANDPFIIEKFKAVDSDLGNLKTLGGKVRDLTEDVNVMREDMARLKGMGSVTTSPVAQASRVAMMTQRLDDIERRLAALEKGSGRAAAPTPRAAVAPTPRAPVAPTPTASPKAPAPSAKAPVAPPPKPTAGAAVPTTGTMPGAKIGAKSKRPKVGVSISAGGSYYTVAEGDTLATIAQKFGISVDDMCKSNTFLKSDSPVFPGTPLWIPKK